MDHLESLEKARELLDEDKASDDFCNGLTDLRNSLDSVSHLRSPNVGIKDDSIFGYVIGHRTDSSDYDVEIIRIGEYSVEDGWDYSFEAQKDK